MKAKTAETPILTRNGDGDYADWAKEPWSCEECITDYYEGNLRRISIAFSTEPSDNAVMIRVCHGNYVYWCRGKSTPDELLHDKMENFLRHHFELPPLGLGVLTLYYTVYER